MRVPRVSDENTYFCLGYFGNASLLDQVRDTGIRARLLVVLREMGNAPEDYRDPEKFFSRTYFTRALKEHAGMVLQRLSGKTEGAAPVLTLISQFGGGKTDTLN